MLLEFPAEDPERARTFWSCVLGVSLEPRPETEGQGWQTHGGGQALGLHDRGAARATTFFVEDLPSALDRVRLGGGEVVHPGERWVVCRDSEGSPFGLLQRPSATGHGSVRRS